MKRLDRQPRFERFLDLPAEMRNEVYEYLEGETREFPSHPFPFA